LFTRVARHVVLNMTSFKLYVKSRGNYLSTRDFMLEVGAY